MSAPKIEIDPTRERRELEDYLGDGFELDRLHQWQRTLDLEAAEIGDDQRLYRTSRAYLYNLTAFAMTQTKLPYLQRLARFLPPGSRLLDYGCGVGSDGLAMAEAGYRVSFADFDNPSVAYLRWRLERRGIEAPIYDIEREVPGGFDGAYSLDVIEHVDDPFGFLEELESRAAIVMVNLLEADAEELHHDLPIGVIIRRAADRRLYSYGIHHGRSHLLIYGPDAVGRLRRIRQRGSISLARMLRRRR